MIVLLDLTLHRASKHDFTYVIEPLRVEIISCFQAYLRFNAIGPINMTP